MKISETRLPGCLLLEPVRFFDQRGFFQETYSSLRYQQAGIPLSFVQDNHSRSVQGVIRGMHFQRTRPQGKLISVLRGEVFDVTVDLRADSATFGQWQGVVLSEDNGHQLWVPPGFAHGFQVLSGEADVIYKCTSHYDPLDEGAFCWDDADVGITWPLLQPLLSEKDRHAPGFAEATGR
ncbi:dTDP-4-dehydrorhamnose 3,5-epimerase [Chromatiaceae bacterium AAb-1]|nr:dTDP-4-dehydrorhamnose 3,5-epimerase [Chromatiaceae bacterium AAb-1]